MNWDTFIAKEVRDTPPSGIRKFFDIVSEMKEAISLGVGEPDFPTPWSVCDEASWALRQGHTHYTSNWGTTSLRKELARYMLRYDLRYDPSDEILVTVGASEGIDLALRAIVNPGDEVIVPEPSFVAYGPCVRFCNGRPVRAPLHAGNGFKLTAEQLEPLITPRTKAIIFPYPNNPTGGIMTREDLEPLARYLAQKEILVISDEIYSELTYGRKHVSIASLPGMRERTVVLNGFSKSFAMTGWRIGFLCGPKGLLAAMCKIHQYTIMCAPVMSQEAAAQALRDGFENDFAEVRRMTTIYNQRRRLLYDTFQRIGLDSFEPEGAFYIFPSIRKTPFTSEAFCEKLLREEKVAVVPGTAFGANGEGFVRCAYACSMANLTEACKRITRFVEKYAR